MPNVIPSPIPFATATAPGVVSTAAQTLGAGAKTFSADVVLASGALLTGTAFTFGAGGFFGSNPAWVTTNTTKFIIQNGTPISGFAGIDLRATAGVQFASSLGASASDVVIKIGSSQVDGSVNASAKIASFLTGLTGTEVESLYVAKGGVLGGSGGKLTINSTVGTQATWGSSGLFVTGSVAEIASLSIPVQVRGNGAVARLISNLGAGASDLCTVAGSTRADGSVNATAKLFSVRSGIGGTEVDKLYVQGDGGVVANAPSTIGTGFANPALRIPIVGSTQTNLFQIGGTTVSTWELAIGFYTGAGAPVISSRAGPLLISLASGTSVSPFTPGTADVGSTTNYWRRVYANAFSNVNGSGATDICTTLGTSTADGSVNSSAKLLSLRTGIGGTEVEYLSIAKNTVVFPSASQTIIKWDSGDVNHWELRAQPGGNFSIGNNTVDYLRLRLSDGAIASDFGLVATNGSGTADYFKVVAGVGRVDQWGTDSSGTPGAATINKPTGISAIASGTNTVTITNSLATATSRVMITWLGDHGAARWWVNRSAGAFTVVLPTNATANTAFAWEVSSLL